MTEQGWPEEVSRFLELAQNWVRQAFPTDGHAHDPDRPTRFSGPECQWCPICQLLAVVSGERPEVSERLAEAGAALGAALRGLLDAATGPARPPDGRVQPIDLDDDGPDDDGPDGDDPAAGLAR